MNSSRLRSIALLTVIAVAGFVSSLIADTWDTLDRAAATMSAAVRDFASFCTRVTIKVFSGPVSLARLGELLAVKRMQAAAMFRKAIERRERPTITGAWRLVQST